MTKIAIFETDNAFAVELRTELTRLGCTVQVFKDGNTGLLAAKNSPPDLILLAAELPPVNGFSVCNKIKKDASLSRVPLILMSAQSSPETFEQHQRLPTRADDYVHKPISFADLLTHIRAFAQVGSPHRIADEDTSMVMDEEVLVMDDSVVSIVTEARPPAVASSEFQTLELNRAPPAGEHMPFLGDDDEEIATVVGTRPELPQELVEQYKARRAAAEAAARAQAQGNAHPTPSGPPPAWGTQTTQGFRGDAGTGAAAQTGPPTDLQRAKNALQQALAQLNQARLEANSLRDQLVAAQAGGAAHASERESLDLREKIHGKDKELLELRDQLAARDRELLANRDGQLSLDRTLSEVRNQLARMTTERDTDAARVEALVADKSLADKRANDFKTGARKIAEQLNQRAKELRDAQAAHDENVERLRREHAASLSQQDERHRQELGEAERAHRAELDRQRQDQEKAIAAERQNRESSDAATIAALEQARRESSGAVDQVEKSAAARVAEAERKAAQRVEELERSLQAKLTKATQSTEEQQKANEAARRELETHKTAQATVRAELDKTLVALRDERAAAGKTREAMQAELARTQQALADAVTARDQLGAQVYQLGAQVQAARDAHAKDRAALEAQLAALETQLAEVGEQAFAELEQRHAAYTKAAEETLKQKLDALRQEHQRVLADMQRENAESLQKAGHQYQEKQQAAEASFKTVKEQLDEELADAYREIGELKNQLGAQKIAAAEERREHDDQVATLAAQRDDLAGQVKRQVAELGKVQEKVAVLEQAQVKARARWDEDRAALKQAKNTLANIVRQLDEAAVAPLEDKK